MNRFLARAICKSAPNHYQPAELRIERYLACWEQAHYQLASTLLVLTCRVNQEYLSSRTCSLVIVAQEMHPRSTKRPAVGITIMPTLLRKFLCVALWMSLVIGPQTLEGQNASQDRRRQSQRTTKGRMDQRNHLKGCVPSFV